MSSYPGLEEFCEGLYSKDIRSPYLLGFIVELEEERMAKGDNIAKRLEHAKEVSEVLFTVEITEGSIC